MTLEELLVIFLIVAFGFGLGMTVMWLMYHRTVGSSRARAAAIIEQAQSDIALMKANAERHAENSLKKERQRFHTEYTHIHAREEKLDRRFDTLEKRLQELTKERSDLHHLRKQLEEEKQTQGTLITKLEEVAQMNAEEARTLLLETIEEELAAHTEKRLKTHKDDWNAQAQKHITNALSRITLPSATTCLTENVSLPDHSLKGRIIGKDGRNIRYLEQLVGVTLLVDDAPGVIVISSFDPFRKAVAKEVLETLIEDGRVTPERIEELVPKAESNLKNQSQKDGHEAALRLGIHALPAKVAELLGTLKWRTSGSQNLFDHSIEVATIAGLLADELGLDSNLAKRMGLLHDIGKGLPHKGMTHAAAGAIAALKAGESETVANGIACHHDEVPPTTFESALIRPANLLSAHRPGARNEKLSELIDRQKKLERLARTFPGIERASALRAGKELLLFVEPDALSDSKMATTTRAIAQKISTDLPLPGRLKITAIREKRVTEYTV